MKYKIFEYDPKNIAKYTKAIKDSIKKSQSIRDEIEKCNIDKIDDYANLGDTFEILALSQAVQVQNLESLTPEKALNVAFNGGEVLRSEYHYSYGNYVLIDHGGGIATLYAHLSDRWVSAGETVELMDLDHGVYVLRVKGERPIRFGLSR